MKKILFLMVAALAVMGCSKDEDVKDEEYEIVAFFNTYNSKDSIHCYAVDDEHLYKQERGSNKVVWKKPVTVPDPIIKDLGYGEKEVIEYIYSFVALDTDKHIYTCWLAAKEREYYCNIGLYSITGEFIKNEKIISVANSPKLIELKDQLEAAKKLPAITGDESAMKSYQAFLDQVEIFISKVQKVSEKAEYTDADYEMLTSAYETSVI